MTEIKEKVDNLVQNSIFSSVMLTNLINDLLDLGKLQNNAFQLNFEKFNLIEVIQEAFQIVMFQAETKKIRLHLCLDQTRQGLLTSVYSDRRRTLQILLNLISNSLKFTTEGGFIKVHLKVLEEQSIEKQQQVKDPKKMPKLKRSSSLTCSNK